jgi:hypothetical protein
MDELSEFFGETPLTMELAIDPPATGPGETINTEVPEEYFLSTSDVLRDRAAGVTPVRTTDYSGVADAFRTSGQVIQQVGSVVSGLAGLILGSNGVGTRAPAARASLFGLPPLVVIGLAVGGVLLLSRK